MRGQSGSGDVPIEAAEPSAGSKRETFCPPRQITPVVASAASGGQELSDMENAAGSMRPGNGTRVLIVVAEKDERETLGTILREKGYLTDAVESGEDAYSRVREGGCDLALIGIKLPDEDGIELIWPLKEIHPGLGVIMMTDPDSRETSIRALNEGAWGYIVKPPDPEELLAAVRQAEERRKLIRDNASLALSAERETSRRKQVEADLRRLQRQVADYAGREQERIGQELHDVLGQQLTGAGLMAKSIQNRVEGLERGRLTEEAHELVKSIQETQKEVRRLARGLSPINLDCRGLMVALDDLVVSTARRSGVQVFLECDGNAFVDDAHASNHLYHIAQEAVSNAARHGEPERIVVSLHTENGRISLEIRDDGRGFAADGTGPEGMGLRIMRYRAERIGARLSVESSPGEGTVVSCSLSERSASA